jgi:8-oxo-dGTP pyrophosphatase MutT (NUDIX family)
VKQPAWTPSASLLVDVRHTLVRAPRRSAVDRFEAWAWRALLDQEGPALLTRHAAPSHLTSSAIVLTPDARHTCLVLHGRIGRWVQPGGHLEAGDLTLGAAAAREVVEETGLIGEVLPDIVVLSRHEAPCRPEVDWHLDVQHLVIADQEPPRVSPESRDVRWWDVEDLPAGLALGVRENLSRALAHFAASR